MISFVMRKLVLVIIVILAIFSVWLYFGISALFSAEKNMFARLDDVVQYYVSMDKDYVQPLAESPFLSDGNKITLLQLSARTKAMNEARNASEKLDQLLAVQRSTISFFSTPGLPEEFTADSRYLNWNKNASNLGEVSRLVYEYNSALSLLNARLRSPAGKIFNYWRAVDHRSYISIDGTLQDETLVSF